MKTKLHVLSLQNKAKQKSCDPLFFRLSIDADKKKLNQLLDEVHDVEVFDEILGQVEEFVKSQNPKNVFSKNELTELAIKHIAKTPYEEYGVWVYYPWLNKLVHLLDEKEFVTVRTNRNQYKITPQEAALLSTKKVGIIGLSVGQSIALTIAMERTCGELRIADFDILELSNLNRIRTGIPNLGIGKTIVVAREIAEIDPFLKVICFHDGITEDNIDYFISAGGKLNVLVDVCDDLTVKILCRQKAKGYGVPVLMDTSDKGMIDVERFDLEPNRPIFHGLIDHLDVSKIKEAKTNEEKVPYLLPMVGIETISSRLKASMMEIAQTITTWPQLASSVVLGGGLGADVCRRILLDQFHDSGRYFVDAEELIADKTKENTLQSDINLNPSISNEEMVNQILNFNSTEIEGQLDLSKETIADIVNAATRAPSGANGQGWKWKYDNKNLYLFYDRIYLSSVLDCNCTTSIVGLGSATENLVLKAHSMNLEVLTEHPPIDIDSILIAVFKFFDKPNEKISSRLEPHVCDELESEIFNRFTNRSIGPRVKIERKKLEDLRTLAQTIPGADLIIIDDEKKLDRIMEITAKMDQYRIMHPKGHQDFRLEIQWTPEQVQQNRFGIDLINTVDLTLSEKVGWHIASQWPVVNLLNKWDLGNGLGRIQRKCIAGASAVGIITMPKFSQNDFYQGGRALERLWLGATKEKISVHPASISTLMFNTFEFGNKEIFPPKMREEIEKMRNEFYDIFSIDLNVGVVLFLRFCIAKDPKGKSIRFPIEYVLSFGK
ncbi:MAG: Rv1355c family protein [Bacteroidetes bacterium]|nr:Rv1355c family protein [Bacteroidota bacterium]